MALSTKCLFLRKPMETLVLSQSQRSVFVDYTLKCPVMHEMLTKKVQSTESRGTLFLVVF